MKKLLLAASLLLSACSTSQNVASTAWGFYNDHYDRELSVGTSTDGKPTVSYSIRPKQQAVMSDAQVQALMAHFAEYAARDGKSVVKQEGAK